MGFKELNIDNQIIINLQNNNIYNPTPVQNSIIPLLLNNFDVLNKAPTGTGKTAAFAIPLVQKIKDQKDNNFDPRILVIAPTRELTIQITNTFKFISKGFNLKTFSVIGGESITKQIKMINHGVDIIVATPGRLVDLIKQRVVNLDNVKYFVLDEADLMLDMGFIKDIQFIKQNLNKNIQSILLSATIPKEVKRLTYDILKKNHKFIEVDPFNNTKTNIKQYISCIEKNNKIKLLVDIIKKNPNDTYIIFINKKREAKFISSNLYYNKIKYQVIHGDKSQTFRNKALSAFKKKFVNVLIATDVAARGIHIDNVNCVINYDVPNNKESYIHRIGRTGRAGRNGLSYTFASPDDYFFLKDILKIKNNKYEVFNHDKYTIEFNIQKINQSTFINNQSKSKKHSFDPNKKRVYKNSKNYETKNDLKRKNEINSFNKKLDLNKKINNFKWENKISINKNKNKKNNYRGYR